MDARVRATQERLLECCRKARPRLTDLPGRMPGKSVRRGVVFYWVLLFWTSKREVPRAPQAHETLLLSCHTKSEKEAPHAPP